MYMHMQIYSTISTRRAFDASSLHTMLPFPPFPSHPPMHLTRPLQALPRPYTSDGAALRQRAVRLPRLRRDALLAHRHDKSRTHQVDTWFRYCRYPLALILPRRYCRVHRLRLRHGLRCVRDLNCMSVTSYRK